MSLQNHPFRGPFFMLIATGAYIVNDTLMKLATESLPPYQVLMLRGVAGLIWLVGGQPTSSGAYDASIHGVFLGFGVSMIMAHAPIIFPAVLGRPLPYRPVMWLPLGLLNLGLIVRVAGDLAGHTAAYKTGGTLTVLAVLVFAVTMIGVVAAARRERAAV